jgi:ribosome modulation factor
MKEEINLEKAKQRGQTDYFLNKPEASNPFKSPKNRSAWKSGYRMAKFVSKKK